MMIMTQFADEIKQALQKQEERMQRFRRRLDEIESQEQELLERAEQLTQEKKKLIEEISMVSRIDVPPLEEQQSLFATTPHKKRKRGRPPNNRLSWKEAAVQTLRTAGRGLTLSEIAETIERTGFRTNSKHKKNVLYQTLYKLRDEGRVDHVDGVYVLSDKEAKK